MSPQQRRDSPHSVSSAGQPVRANLRARTGRSDLHLALQMSESSDLSPIGLKRTARTSDRTAGAQLDLPLARPLFNDVSEETLF